MRLLSEYGRLEESDWSALRLVLFAGEVFPVKHLRAIKKIWAGPRYYNLYGPTETKRLHLLRDSIGDSSGSHRAVPDRIHLLLAIMLSSWTRTTRKSRPVTKVSFLFPAGR